MCALKTLDTKGVAVKTQPIPGVKKSFLFVIFIWAENLYEKVEADVEYQVDACFL